MDRKILLNEKDIPRQWYNLAADLPTPLLPPLGPDGKPIGPEMLAPVFPMNLIEQEVNTERWIDIPEGILDILYRSQLFCIPSQPDRLWLLQTSLFQQSDTTKAK